MKILTDQVSLECFNSKFSIRDKNKVSLACLFWIEVDSVSLKVKTKGFKLAGKDVYSFKSL
jgi:hypothetical protein